MVTHLRKAGAVFYALFLRICAFVTSATFFVACICADLYICLCPFVCACMRFCGGSDGCGCGCGGVCVCMYVNIYNIFIHVFV